MANEEKRAVAHETHKSNGYRIAVNVIILVIVIITSFAAGFATSTLVQAGRKDRPDRPDFSQMREMQEKQNRNMRNRPNKESLQDSSNEKPTGNS